MAYLDDVLHRIAETAANTTTQGRRFEQITQAAFRAHPDVYGKERFKNVWLWDEWPDRTRLGYTGDIGIDLVAEQTPAYGGGLCAIQCKFRSAKIPTSDVDSFLAASATDHFTARILVTASEVSKVGLGKLLRASPRCELLTTSEMDRWVDDWRAIITDPDSIIIPPARKHALHGYQKDAVRNIDIGFKTSDRGQLILPCGTGKSLVALKTAEQIAPRGGRVLYLVPSIALIGQTMKEWSQQRTKSLRYLGVCSDTSAGRKTSQSGNAGDIAELAIPVTTDLTRLAEELAKPVPEDTILAVFSTYHSLPQISAAQTQADTDATFDLIICDEAHRTTGIENITSSKDGTPLFQMVHDNDLIQGRKRLYQTATPRVFTEQQKRRQEEAAAAGFAYDSYSMDNPEVYGPVFYQMSFAEAIDGGYLSDYQVLVIAVSEQACEQFLKESGLDDIPQGHDEHTWIPEYRTKLAGCWDALSSPDTTGVIPGRKPGQIHPEEGIPARTAIAFTNQVSVSQWTAGYWTKMTERRAKPPIQDNLDGQPSEDAAPSDTPPSVFLRILAEHMDGNTPASKRARQLDTLRTHTGVDKNGQPTCRVISNARVLTEGVDVPSLDTVVFLSPRSSAVDITQAVGRAMRKTAGKTRGYIVIPVIVPDNASPQKMLQASDFKTVWQVVRALRSHDERVGYYVNNKTAWKKKAPFDIRVPPFGQPEGKEHLSESYYTQLAFQLSEGIASKVVEMAGDKKMYPRWGKRAATICRTVHTRITELVTDGGIAADAFGMFVSGIRKSIGDHITREQALEMIAHHVVTVPVFNVMLRAKGFADHNPVSQEIEQLLSTFRDLGVSFRQETAPLKRAYRQMSEAFEGALSSAERVDILRSIYDGFFREAMPDTVKQVGIVYTPVEIVDFMIQSAEAICQKEFGRGLGSENLHILDPFSGTGTFLARLIETRGSNGNYLISQQDLDRKYKHELHANELILLAYYITAVKIEESKHSRDAETCEHEVDYEPYSNICLSDTFLASPTQEEFGIFKKNIKRRQIQNDTPITVILANPPWSAGQKSTGDDNPNIRYPDISNRVVTTYGTHHRDVTGKGIGKASGNLYIKALRWCSDRVLPNDENHKDRPSVIGLVHPNSLTDAPSLAGVRACLRDEFTDIYVVNLRGNASKSGEDRRKEGYNVFSDGSRNGGQITFLVRNPDKPQDQPAVLHYAQVPDYMGLDQKFEWLNVLSDVTNPDMMDTVPVTDKHDWVNISDGSFEEFLPVCTTDKNNVSVGVRKHALGVTTACDVYVYSFDRQGLIDKLQCLIEAYNEALDWYESNPCKEILEQATRNDSLDEIKWTGRLKSSLRQCKRIVFDEGRIREVLYRPFVKLWLYEDDRILSSVKTVSAMFPRDGAVEGVAVTSGSNNGSSDSLVASDVMADLNSVGPGRGGGALACPPNNRGTQSRRNRPSPSCNPQKVAILISSGNNMTFQAMASEKLTDLAAIKGSQQTRVIPRVR